LKDEVVKVDDDNQSTGTEENKYTREEDTDERDTDERDTDGGGTHEGGTHEGNNEIHIITT